MRSVVAGALLLLCPSALAQGRGAGGSAFPTEQTASRPRASAEKPAALSEPQALTLLSAAIERDRVYAPMARACMTFVVEVRSEMAFEIAVREKHGGRCGGDPAAAPILDRFKVDRASRAITVWDILEQDWYSWAEFKRHRDGRGQ